MALMDYLTASHTSALRGSDPLAEQAPHGGDQPPGSWPSTHVPIAAMGPGCSVSGTAVIDDSGRRMGWSQRKQRSYADDAPIGGTDDRLISDSQSVAAIASRRSSCTLARCSAKPGSRRSMTWWSAPPLRLT